MKSKARSQPLTVEKPSVRHRTPRSVFRCLAWEGWLVLFLIWGSCTGAEIINRDAAVDTDFEFRHGIDKPVLQLAESSPISVSSLTLIRAALARVKPDIVVELHKHVAHGKLDKLQLYNHLRGFGSMQGVKYYSVSGDKLKVLFEKSYGTDSAFKKISPPAVTDIPLSETLYFYQKDRILGDNYNVANLYRQQNEIAAHYHNHKKLTYAFVTVVVPGNLNTFIVVTDSGDGHDIYVVSFVKTASVPLLKKRISKSFGNRLIAIYNWLLTGIQ